jgi:ATP/maltotriose-dependent transcriptional regulator MalT
MSFWLQAKIPTDYSVHHINENRMDARKENLSLVLNKVHNSQHNKGRKPTKTAVDKLIAFNHTRKGTKQKYKRSDIPLSKVESMIQEGYSINRISQVLNCDWSTIKSRLNEIHDNPDLLK